MSKIILSKTGNTYDIAVNGFNKSDSALSLTVLATGESIEFVEEVFTGNDNIKLVDQSITMNAYGYTVVDSIGIQHDYVLSEDEDGPITADVWHIVLKKASLEERVTATEDAIAELAEIISEV